MESPLAIATRAFSFVGRPYSGIAAYLAIIMVY